MDISRNEQRKKGNQHLNNEESLLKQLERLIREHGEMSSIRFVDLDGNVFSFENSSKDQIELMLTEEKNLCLSLLTQKCGTCSSAGCSLFLKKIGLYDAIRCRKCHYNNGGYLCGAAEQVILLKEKEWTNLRRYNITEPLKRVVEYLG